MVYIIADLKLYDKEQMKKLGCENFDQMNKIIIDSWNREIKDNDTVIVMGNIGCGEINEMKFVISQLKGQIVSLAAEDVNEKYKVNNLEEIGIKFVYRVPMYKTFSNGDKALYMTDNMFNARLYKKDYRIIIVDEKNKINDIVRDNLLSVDALKWNYCPLNTDELITIYENMKQFYSMNDMEERITEIKEVD